MAANTDLLQPTSTGAFDWLMQGISKVAAEIGSSYRRATGRKVVRSLDERQRRDVDIDAVYEAQSKAAAAKAVLLANLSSMR